MRKFLYVAGLLAFITIILSSTTASCQKEITFTVTHIERSDSLNEVMVRRGYQYWKGECKTIPDSLKVGDKMIAVFSKTKDSCNCYFKRIR